ncbi:MAG: hypothetical protein IPN57_03205 [Ignavibacteria bacterium]|nr:hypothetical protein [Ignavibacteria bacterium]
MLEVTDEFEMMAIFRMGYTDPKVKRPVMTGNLRRKEINELAFSNRFGILSKRIKYS